MQSPYVGFAFGVKGIPLTLM